MVGRLFEGWHLVILIILILVLFGAKRLPDAARGMGRSLRIFKAEVKEMREDEARSGRRAEPGTAPSGPGPLEGRIVDGDSGRTAAPSEQRHDL